MKNLIFLLVVAIACVAGIGFYRGWFQFSSQTAGDSSTMTLTVDKDKLHADEKKLAREAQDAADHHGK
jgi:hypothetical protein